MLVSARGVGCRLRGDASIGPYNRCVKHTVPWLVYKNRPINPDYFCMILTKCVTFLFQNLQSL